MIIARPPDPSSAYADLVDVVLGLGREVARQTRFDGIDVLSPTEVSVARHIASHPGTSPSEVADGLGLQRTNVSPAVKRLEGLGMVERVRTGRAVRLEVTEGGREQLRRIRAEWARVLGAALDGPPEGLAITLRTLRHTESTLAQHRLAVLDAAAPSADGSA